ncbi:hypothetical protein NQ314_013543 [Rhamnusium bicolor]|uniref:Uncharacterized protein n=1 Tax=Rhamnusium bicolor TaxID=1586634 RepID=A0AAV8X5W7_9CUCU|nr:hypothetical protein NQ314_013543 [Rhamnusium bicolor]
MPFWLGLCIKFLVKLMKKFMAGYKFLTYLFLGTFISWLLGYRIETYIVFVLFMFLLYKSIKAVGSSRSPVRHNYPTEGFGNISFSDSFLNKFNIFFIHFYYINID